MSSKYKKQLIIVIIIIVFCSVIFLASLIQYIIFQQHNSDFITPLIPISNVNLLFSIIFFITIFANIIGGVIMGYVLGPVFLYVHKKIIGKKLIYGIQQRPKINGFKGTFKSFFPTLLAFSLSLWLLEHEDIAKLFVEESQLQSGYGLFVIYMITSGISMGLFSSVWVITDSGIVYTNKEKIKLSTKPIEVRSVGGWFQNFLKGYAGISVIFALYISLFQGFSQPVPLYGKVLVAIGLLCEPIFFTLLGLPAIIILDKILDRRKNYMLKFAKKLGIVDNMDLTITLSNLNKLSPRMIKENY